MTSTRTARPRTFLIGIFTGLFALTLLLTVVIIQRSGASIRYALIVLPVLFAALALLEFRRSVAAPDEGDR